MKLLMRDEDFDMKDPQGSVSRYWQSKYLEPFSRRWKFIWAVQRIEGWWLVCFKWSLKKGKS